MSQSMKKVISDLLTNLNLKEAFEKARAGEFHVRLTNKPYMPLVIEKIADNMVSVAHYGEQNGDAMRDPEMVFRIQGDEWQPFSFQNDGLGLYQEVYAFDENGHETGYRPKLLKSLSSFAATWAKNIRDQGFLNKERTQAESDSHQWILDGKPGPDADETEVIVPEQAEDAHLDAAYEGRTEYGDLEGPNEYGDYEPSIYDGTYSEE